MTSVYQYLCNLFLAFSRLLNVLLLAGDPNESICGRCYRESWIWPMRVLDMLLSPFSKGHHCRGAFNQDRNWAIKAAQWPSRVQRSEAALND